MTDQLNALAQSCLGKISDRTARVGIIGMGYVGLPLAVAFGGAGIRVLGFDVGQGKAVSINAGQSYIKHIVSERETTLKGGGLLKASTDALYSLAELDQPPGPS